MLGYPARYIRETIAPAPGLRAAVHLKLDTDGKVGSISKTGIHDHSDMLFPIVPVAPF